MRPVSDAQVRKLMEEMSKHGHIGMAAMKAGMDRKTARKYVQAGALPSAMIKPRDWRTRPDPFVEHWPEVEARLREAPGLEAKTLLEWLADAYPDRYEPGQLRTLQRRVKTWRAEQGPEKNVVLAQQHRPGEAIQTDFTWATELGITLGGEPFPHMLCVVTLPYSNWRWATLARSESIAAIRGGLQRALFQLGRVPQWHQTDHSTAATHRLSRREEGAGGEPTPRPFNEDYLAIMRHFGMKPRTTAVGAKEQNGDVEASNGALKRNLEQALLLRGSRDFESADVWQAFVDARCMQANRTRGPRLTDELLAMRELNVARLPEFVEDRVRVSEWSTVRVRHCSYSVPSRLISEWVDVRIFEEAIVVLYKNTIQLSCERLRGRHQRRIDYRHVIWSLVRKPGGFARYIYREEMFPSVTFRRAYDALQTSHAGVKGDLEYLRILHHAASTLEADVEAALTLLLADPSRALTSDAVKALTVTKAPPEVPQLAPHAVDLAPYDALLGEVGT